MNWHVVIKEKDHEFRDATDIQRPPPVGVIQKNWFLFWDSNGEMYTHYDISPQRSFAKLSLDGTAGPDLAEVAREKGDEKCMAKYMPYVKPIYEESIHQATNSLAITLCMRSDPRCKPDDSNTFIFTIFQLKTYYFFHSVYEPYVMLFQQTAPFAVHAISKKPLWIGGRGGPGKGKKPDFLPEELRQTWNHTEMFYITSISWKDMGQKYHGYVDDVMFIGFGIEDERTAALDVKAGDLLKDLGLCGEGVGGEWVGGEWGV